MSQSRHLVGLKIKSKWESVRFPSELDLPLLPWVTLVIEISLSPSPREESDEEQSIFTVVSMAFYNLLCCTTLSLADANVVQFYSCLNRCCRGLCWCPGTTSSLELGKSRAVRAIPSLRLSHGGERKTGRVKPFLGAIFVTALNGLLMSDFPEKTNTILIW